MKRIINKIRKLFFREKGVIPKKYISRFVAKDPVIIEAGAHIGTDTCEMAETWPNARIYAFEPIPEIFEQLLQNTSKYTNVQCFKLALGDKNGKTKIYKSSGESDGSSSLLKPKEHLRMHPGVKFENDIEIEVVTLKDWARNNKIEMIDFLWLDLQGFELDMMQASKKIIANATVIYTEVSLIENYQNSGLYPELKSWLNSLGFKTKKEELAWKDGGNVLFVKK